MLIALAMLLILAAVILAVMVLVQASRGTVELLSTRNFFLLGFIVFQLSSGVLTLLAGAYDVLPVSDQPRAGAIYTFLVLLFIPVFLWAYKRKQLAHWVATRFTGNTDSPGPMSMLGLGYAFLVLAIVLKFAVVYIPYLGIIADAVGSSYLVLAVGIAAWAVAPRIFNAPVLALAMPLVLLCFITSVSRGAFGRRDIVAMVISMAWGAYYSHWRYVGLSRLLIPAGLVMVPGLLLFGAFTATRTSGETAASPAQVVSRLISSNPLNGLYELGTGQFAAANSMWLIQTRPESYPFDPLHTARYVLFHPIPRSLWPGKPTALGLVMPDQGHVKRVDPNLNLGPGLIGHIYNDNPWLSFLPYTIVLGLFLGFLDELVRVRVWNPFVVLPIACGLGQIVALPRGELGLFFVLTVVYITGGWVAMTIVGMVLRSLGLVAPAPAGAPPDEPEWEGRPATE
ncbi:MAG: hypothetical protein IT437_00795 [Phycisphaerales bacterium]|nr:hypothetical protein [Phycisphaerales bacterium]